MDHAPVIAAPPTLAPLNVIAEGVADWHVTSGPAAFAVSVTTVPNVNVVLAVCPSGFVTVNVYDPAAAPPVFRVAVTCVVLTKVRLLTAIVLGPVIFTWSLLKPGPPASAPGSKNSELFVEVPLIVMGAEEHLIGVEARTGVAGGGALNCAALNPQTLVVGAYSLKVQIV